MNKIKIYFSALILFISFDMQSQITDTIPMPPPPPPIETEYDSMEAMPMIEESDYYYEDAVMEAPAVAYDEMSSYSSENTFNKFQFKTIAKLEDSPEKAAFYPGGIGAMMTEIQSNLKKPYMYGEDAKYVILQITVGKDSMLYNPQVIYTEGNTYSNYAKQAVESLNLRFVPAKKNGKPVDSIIIIPIRFENTQRRKY